MTTKPPVAALPTDTARRSTTNGLRWPLRGALLVAVLSVLALAAAPTALAATTIASSGTLGPIYGIGGTVCNPYLSGSGYNKYRIEIGSPLVGETPQVSAPGTSTVGGGQMIKWQPWLEKYVSGRWVTVWTGRWYERNYWGGTSTTFGDPLVDVRYLGSYSGSGYYRSGGTLWWVADSSHAGGWIQYRHSTHNYFINGYADSGSTYATPVDTPYCHAG